MGPRVVLGNGEAAQTGECSDAIRGLSTVDESDGLIGLRAQPLWRQRVK